MRIKTTIAKQGNHGRQFTIEYKGNKINKGLYDSRESAEFAAERNKTMLRKIAQI